MHKVSWPRLGLAGEVWAGSVPVQVQKLVANGHVGAGATGSLVPGIPVSWSTAHTTRLGQGRDRSLWPVPEESRPLSLLPTPESYSFCQPGLRCPQGTRL